MADGVDGQETCQGNETFAGERGQQQRGPAGLVDTGFHLSTPHPRLPVTGEYTPRAATAPVSGGVLEGNGVASSAMHMIFFLCFWPVDGRGDRRRVDPVVRTCGGRR